METKTLPPEFSDRLEQVLGGTGRQRVAAFDVGGRRYWVKRVEVHRTRLRRLIKGDPGQALLREAATLRRLAQRGVPVPPVVAEGEDYLVLGDVGPTLDDLLADPSQNRDQVVAAFRAAGRALAGLHAQGMGHGRAIPKDFCWDGHSIAFIDFENDANHFELARDGGREIVHFLFGTFRTAIRQGRDLSPEIAAFVTGYREAGDGAALAGAQRWARRRWWWIPLIAPFAWLKAPRKGADLKAVAPALIHAAQFLEG